MPNISTDISSPVSYVAGVELVFKLTLTAPEDGTYYVIGALYDGNYNLIQGTRFGILLPEGAEYAFNSTEYTQLWELVKDEVKEIDCKLTLSRSSAILGLFLMKMVGESPSLDDDEEKGSTELTLLGAAPAGVDLNAFIGLIAVVGIMGIAMKAVAE